MCPTYSFKCVACDHEEDMSMPWDVYRENRGVFPCPMCEADFERVWSGVSVIPGIKTVERVEDMWRKKGLLDPEDPEYTKRNKERIKYMREKNKKKLDRMLEDGSAVVGKTASVGGKDVLPMSREDLDNLPDVAVDKHVMTKDGEIKPKE